MNTHILPNKTDPVPARPKRHALKLIGVPTVEEQAPHGNDALVDCKWVAGEGDAFRHDAVQ